ncbi:MAG TPA: hypothetical protein VJ063_02615 [Verrucomicrobiae bacterium]|nr:hypothetical protein [Verrucomicrobiae bacterium]
MLHFDWDTFIRDGLAVVEQAIRDYHKINKTEPSEFDRMPLTERIAFLRKHISFQVVQRRSDLWWIDLMRPVGDGSIPGPIGPPHRVEFHASQGRDHFLDALLRLISSADNTAKRQ